MNSIEMMARYSVSRNVDTLLDLIIDLIKEIKTLAEKRQVQSDVGISAILREQDDKFHAFARQYPEINPDSFKIVIHKVLPDTIKLWKHN